MRVSSRVQTHSYKVDLVSQVHSSKRTHKGNRLRTACSLCQLYVMSPRTRPLLMLKWYAPFKDRSLTTGALQKAVEPSPNGTLVSVGLEI